METLQVPLGLCQCGCGQLTSIAKRTYTSRGVVKGQPQVYVQSHSARISRRGYVRHRVDGESVQEHVAIAERALGKPLPPGVEIHHVDENRRNNANRNLVICPDRTYHKLLHVRARVVRAGGNPNTQRICSACHQLKEFSAFSRCRALKADGLGRTCRACQVEYRKTYVRPSKRAREAA